ncbi:hypothetical protein Ancab_039202, partial [Ancistrocladus abbreviatus]
MLGLCFSRSRGYIEGIKDICLLTSASEWSLIAGVVVLSFDNGGQGKQKDMTPFAFGSVVIVLWRNLKDTAGSRVEAIR